jgi:hypothetical protein
LLLWLAHIPLSLLDSSEYRRQLERHPTGLLAAEVANRRRVPVVIAWLAKE